MKRSVVVLGAHAFSGQDFVDLLLDDPDTSVVGVSRTANRPSFFLRFHGRPELERYRFVPLDMNTQMPELLALLDEVRPRYIVNFAAQSEVAPSWEHPEHWYQTNCVALARLVNHLRRQDYVHRYVHISSPEVYGTCEGTVREDAPLRPSTPYAASKAAADMLLFTYQREFGFPLVMVRSTNVYGARQQLFKIIPRSVIYLKLGRVIDLHGGGVAVKSYIHIRDVSRGELAIMERGQVGQIYHLSPERGVAVRDVVRTICDALGVDFDRATRMVAERPGQDAAYVIDSSRARRELGWAPTVTLTEGLGDVVQWVEKNWDELQRQPLEYRHRP